MSFLLVGFYSCSNDEIVVNNENNLLSEYTEEIEKLNSTAESENKDYPDEELGIPVWNSSTKALIAYPEGYVGVIMDKTCGQYDRIDIIMDCEDDKTQKKIVGWIGGVSQSKNGNITIPLCVVPYDAFSGLNYGEFAVVDVSNPVYYVENRSHEFFRVLMTGEYNNNQNRIDLNGVSLRPKTNQMGLSWGFGPTYLEQYYDTKITSMRFIILPEISYGSTELPNLGFSYGVFGQLSGHQNGSFYSDDQDGSNGNDIISGPYWFSASSAERTRLSNFVTQNTAGTTLKTTKAR